MIELQCDTCGNTMKIVGSSEWKGEACISVLCQNCYELSVETLDDLAVARNTVDDLNDEIKDLNTTIEDNDNIIQELRDFIDGYIDDK